MFGRLTWNNSDPAPFESGASILRKVMEINYLSKSELINLIKIGGDVEIDPTYETAWIDFDRFGAMLRVTPERLRQGFLDQLGFSNRGLKVSACFDLPGRYCPECRQYGYECVFFQLLLIAECPWHGRKLLSNSEPCSYCINYRFSNEPNLVICPKCGDASLPYALRQFTHRFSQEQRYTILGYCLALTKWRMNFKEQTGEYERLIWQLDDRYGCVDPERRKRQRGITHHFYNQTSWILGYAQTVQKEPLLWKFSVQSNPTSFVQVVDRERIPWSKFTGDPAPLIHSSDGAIYRSIKHQLYKRFVRAHKACLARLLKLKYDESRCIDGNSVCPIALAYLTWRMSIERLGNLEGLTVRRKNTYSIKFMSPSQNASLRFRQIWSHLSFNALVSFYQHSCGIRKIAVDFDAERPCNGYVISHPSKGKNQTEEKFFILHPQVLPNMSLVECKLVRAKRDLLVSQTMNRFSYWAWGLNSEPSNTVIQVQLPSDSSSSTNQHYSYIQI